jgi:hypothetical protein
MSDTTVCIVRPRIKAVSQIRVLLVVLLTTPTQGILGVATRCGP